MVSVLLAVKDLRPPSLPIRISCFHTTTDLLTWALALAIRSRLQQVQQELTMPRAAIDAKSEKLGNSPRLALTYLHVEPHIS